MRQTISVKPMKKGMVLAAGLGTRLLPITGKFPKPLVPVLDVPNILHSFYLLKRAGIVDIVLNLHHLADQLEGFLGKGEKWGLNLSFSKETQLLGTGGGVKKAEPFFEGQSFVLVNCDFLSDLDLMPYIQRHQARGALATMVLHQNPKVQRHYSEVGVDEAGNLCSLPRCHTKAPARTGIFTGIHFLAPETLKHLEPVPSGINDKLYPVLMQGEPERVFGEFTSNAYWYDTGEVETLWSASMRSLARLPTSRVLRDFIDEIGQIEEREKGIWVPKGMKLPPGVKLNAPALLGRDGEYGEGVELGPYLISGSRCRYGAKARVKHTVALDDSVFAANHLVENALQFHQNTMPAKRAETRDEAISI